VKAGAVTNSDIFQISYSSLAICLIPLTAVATIYWRWTNNKFKIPYASLRMIVQLVLVGFALNILFNHQTSELAFLILIFMWIVSSWISLNPLKAEIRRKQFKMVLLCMMVGPSISIGLIFFFVLDLEPWFQFHYFIPICGMIFSNTMTALSLAAERLEREQNQGRSFFEARGFALEASLIPLLNSFFAVGLVSLPGMMTGQILGGVDPIIAVRYQIMILAVVLGSEGLSVATYLWSQGRFGQNIKS